MSPVHNTRYAAQKVEPPQMFSPFKNRHGVLKKNNCLVQSKYRKNTQKKSEEHRLNFETHLKLERVKPKNLPTIKPREADLTDSMVLNQIFEMNKNIEEFDLLDKLDDDIKIQTFTPN